MLIGDCRAQAMEQPPRKVAFFPVVDEGRLAGIVTLHGLVSAGLCGGPWGGGVGGAWEGPRRPPGAGGCWGGLRQEAGPLAAVHVSGSCR